jgi:Tol biopolymer transport system component
MRVQRMAAGVGMAVLLVGCTVRVSVDTKGGDPNSSSVEPSVSADGRYVAFASLASDLVEGDGNGLHDVYRRDLEENRTTRVSVDKAGGDPNFDSFDASISSDGNKVAFLSNASDLVDGDTNGKEDIFVRNMRTAVTTRASVDAGGGDANDHSSNPDISANGRVVAFASFASDLRRR